MKESLVPSERARHPTKVKRALNSLIGPLGNRQTRPPFGQAFRLDRSSLVPEMVVAWKHARMMKREDLDRNLVSAGACTLRQQIKNLLLLIRKSDVVSTCLSPAETTLFQ